MNPEDHPWDDWMEAAVLPSLGLTVGQVKTCREHFLDYLHLHDPFTEELRDDIVLSGDHPRCFLGEGELEDLLERVCHELSIPISYKSLKKGEWWRLSPSHSLAFAMASHPRLGRACVFRELPRDALEKIIKSWVEPWAAFKRDHTFPSFVKVVASQVAVQPLDQSDVARDWILQRCKACQKWRRRNHSRFEGMLGLQPFACNEIGRGCAETENDEEDKAERWWRKRWWRLEGSNDLADEDSDADCDEDMEFVLHDAESEDEESEGGHDDDEENQGDAEGEEGDDEEHQESAIQAAIALDQPTVSPIPQSVPEAGSSAGSGQDEGSALVTGPQHQQQQEEEPSQQQPSQQQELHEHQHEVRQDEAEHSQQQEHPHSKEAEEQERQQEQPQGEAGHLDMQPHVVAAAVAAASAEEEGNTSTSCAGEGRELSGEEGAHKGGGGGGGGAAPVESGMGLQAMSVSSGEEVGDDDDDEEWEDVEIEALPPSFSFALGAESEELVSHSEGLRRLRKGNEFDEIPDRICITVLPDPPRDRQLLRSRLRTANAIDRIGPTSLRVLLRRAGVSRCSHAVYTYARALLKGLVADVLHAALRHAEHGGRLTVSVADVEAGLAVQGKKIYGTGFTRVEGQVVHLGNTSYLHKSAEHSARHTQLPPPQTIDLRGALPRQSAVLRAMRRQQKHSGHLAIVQGRFQHLARQLVWECPEVPGAAADKVRVEGSALAALQEVVEERLALLFKDALCCAVYARSTALLPEDIRFAFLGMAQRHY